MAEAGWPGQTGHEQPRANTGTLLLQVLIAALALVVFLWLINILLEHGKDPVLPGLADAVGRNAWIGICLGLEGVFLISEVLLLRPGMRKAVAHPKQWVSNRRSEDVWQDTPIAEPHAPQHLIGCPGCGTVFDAAEQHTDANGMFGCPNCGRRGRLRKQESPVSASLHDVDCPKCSHHYQAYQRESECPNCGQHIRVKQA